MPFRTKDTVSTAKGTYNTKNKTFQGKGKAPAGYKKTPSVKVTRSPSGKVTITRPPATAPTAVSGPARSPAATSPRRRVRRAAKAPRVPRIRPQTAPPRPRALKTYSAPKVKPVAFSGPPARSPKPQAAPRRHIRRAKAILARPLPNLSAKESRTAQIVLKQGARKGASKKELLAAAETGLVESHFNNLPMSKSDGTSAGWRQETEQERYGPESRRRKPGPTARDYFSETAAAGRGVGMTAGQLAQTVQGSAYPERYDQVKDEAVPIVKGFLKKVRVAKKAGLPLGNVDPALKAFNKQVRRQLLYVKRGEYTKGPGSLVVGDADISKGHEPEIAARLKMLSAKIGKPVYIISGDRTPQHSVEVGGFADDPHTKGQAADIGIGSALRDSAGTITEKMYNSVGLHRPYYPASSAEINHVELLHGGTPATGSSGFGGGGFGGAAGASSGSLSTYAAITGQSPKAVQRQIREGKITPKQIFAKLKSLGVGPSTKTTETTSAQKSKATLKELEKRYGRAAV